MPLPLNKVKQLKTDYSIVFNSPEGRRVLHDILKNTHVLEPTFNIDPYNMAFNEGARNEALRILSILQFKPEDFVQIAQEIQDE
jgi:hypothetical protein